MRMDMNPIFLTFPCLSSVSLCRQSYPHPPGTFWSIIIHERNNISSSHHFTTNLSVSNIAEVPISDDHQNMNSLSPNHRPKIAIIGGGIAGVTAAASIASRFHTGSNASTLDKSKRSSLLDVDITIYEADANYSKRSWDAATALNAQSMVPSVSMHCFSQRETLFQVVKETISGMIFPYTTSNDLSIIPPTLKFSIQGCLGPSCSWPERYSFLSFLYHFLKTSLTSSSETLEKRGAVLYQLANANQAAFRRRLQSDSTLANRIGYKPGFVTFCRWEKDSQRVMREAQEYGFEARLLNMDQLRLIEPRWTSLPLPQPSFAIFCPQDSSSNCAIFVQDMIEKLCSMGVSYEIGEVCRVQRCPQDSKRFCVRTAHGSNQQYDYIVLAAGAYTPLLAQQLGAPCPIYPLRGWSLSIACDPKECLNMNHSFSFDHIYCSSTSVDMVRLAGFGEMVGYKSIAAKIQSQAPEILKHYAKVLVPLSPLNTGRLIPRPCFRPLSPDDLPIVGMVRNVSGLFLHTGHGTLGWTLSLATAECLGQSVEEEINKRNGNDCAISPMFTLPDGSKLDKNVLSPDRV
jgi:glycine/D-amino acid oxidase-like deaminating enzyme